VFLLERTFTIRVVKAPCRGGHRTLSQEITRILTEAVHGQGLPAECRPPPGGLYHSAPPLTPTRCRAADLKTCRMLQPRPTEAAARFVIINDDERCQLPAALIAF